MVGDGAVWPYGPCSNFAGERHRLDIDVSVPLRKSAVVDFASALRCDHFSSAPYEGVEDDLARMDIVVLRGGHESGETNGALRLYGAEQFIQYGGADVAPAAMMGDLDQAKAAGSRSPSHRLRPTRALAGRVTGQENAAALLQVRVEDHAAFVARAGDAAVS